MSDFTKYTGEYHTFEHNGTVYKMPILNPSAITIENSVEESRYEPLQVSRHREALYFMTLYVTDACNFACKYCFAAGNSLYSGRSMSLETVRQAISLLFDSPASHVTIRFFGGEPLLNFPLIISAVDLAEEQSRETGKSVSFNLFTNGSLLHSGYVQFLGRHNFTVYVSIGGSEEMHNSLRPLKGGAPSFQQVTEGARRILDRFPYRVVARVIVDPHRATPSLTEMAEFLIGEIGFRFISFEVPWVARRSRFALDQASMLNMKEQFARLAEAVLSRFLDRNLEWAGIHQFGRLLLRLTDRETPLDVYSCGAGSEMLAVSTDGTLYPCHGFVGMERFSLGHVSSGLDRRSDLYKTFLTHSAETVPSCRRCWARFLCPARCPFDAYLFNRDIWRPNNYRCELEKYIIELGLYLYATLKYEAPDVLKIIKWISQKRMKVGVW